MLDTCEGNKGLILNFRPYASILMVKPFKEGVPRFTSVCPPNIFIQLAFTQFNESRQRFLATVLCIVDSNDCQSLEHIYFMSDPRTESGSYVWCSVRF